MKRPGIPGPDRAVLSITPDLRPTYRTRNMWEDRGMVSHDDVRRLALEMPGSFEKESYGGRPSWRTKARMFTWIREEPEALVVWVESEEDKHALISSEPEKFFTTSHYDGHPIVLVRLEAVDDDEAAELIIESWRQRATKTAVEHWDADHPTVVAENPD